MAFKRHVSDKEGLDLLVNNTDIELSSLHLSSFESSSSLEGLLEDSSLLQDDAIKPAQSCSDWKELGTICNKFLFTGNGVNISNEIAASDVLETF